MLKIIRFAVLVFSLSVFTSVFAPLTAHAKGSQIYTSWRNNQAVGGFDVVSFHTGNPVKGRDKIKVQWNGAQWQFATQANLETFLENPDQYAPAYGGYCAWALAKNKLAKGSPKYWTIQNEVLYLNFNKKIQTRWLKDIDGFIIKGDSNWPKILK